MFVVVYRITQTTKYSVLIIEDYLKEPQRFNFMTPFQLKMNLKSAMLPSFDNLE